MVAMKRRRRSWGIGPRASRDGDLSLVVVGFPEGMNIEISHNISRLGWALISQQNIKEEKKALKVVRA